MSTPTLVRCLVSGFLVALILVAAPLSLGAEDGAEAAAAAPALSAFERWADACVAARSGGAPAPALEDGIRLARDRRAAMRDLMRDDPTAAVAHALPDGIRRALPPAVAALVEERVRGRGDIRVDRSSPHPAGVAPDRLPRIVSLGGRTYPAIVCGTRACDQDFLDVPLWGIAIDGVMVVAPSPLERVGSGDVPEAPRIEGGVFAREGGEIRRFADEATFEAYERRVLYPTGALPLAPQDLARLRARPAVGSVRPNRTWLERVNAERRAKGIPALRETDVPLAPHGREMVPSPVPSSAALFQAPLDLPSAVDNSKTKYFPPIRDQGSLGSCAAFAAAYYQLTTMTARARDWDAAAGGDTFRFSPKWVYTMKNGGENEGTYIDVNLDLVAEHGCATWAEFPYDGNYRAWCLNPAVWRAAIGRKTDPCVMLWDVDTDAGLAKLKALLAGGYVVTFATQPPYSYADWEKQQVRNDPDDPDDDAFVGKSICRYVRVKTAALHAMTIVGYNDHVWCDINGNGRVDAGEKGALRIANSWGNWEDGGFTWLAYDALRPVSAVSGFAPADKVAGFDGSVCYVATARASYTPGLLMKFTVLHPKRSDMKMLVGMGSTSETAPSASNQWNGEALYYDGGPYAFDGSTSSTIQGTFYLDVSNLGPAIGATKRYFLGMQDGSATPSTGSILSATLIDAWDGEREIATITPSANPGQFNPPTGVANASTAWCWVDYQLPAPAGTPSIEVVAPNGGEYFNPNGSNGFSLSVIWHADRVSIVNVDLLKGGARFKRLASGLPAARSLFKANISNTTASGDDFTVSVSSADPGGSAGDASDAPFTIDCPPAPQNVTVSPANVNLPAGAQQPYFAVVYDQWGAVMAPPPPITWSVDAGGGTIDGAGLLTAGDTAGAYRVEAKAGLVWSSVTVYIGTAVKPVVWVALKPGADRAYEGNRAAGAFEMRRAPAGPDPIAIGITLKGTASEGVDYDPVGTTVTIPGSAEKAEVVVHPRLDSLVEGDETVKLNVASASDYVTGKPSIATVLIVDAGAPVEITVPLAAGYTLIAPPLDAGTSLTAEGLAQQINAQGGTCTSVIAYDAATGAFVTHPAGTAVSNFDIEVGKGYFVRCAAAGTWRAGGFRFSAPAGALTLKAGYNLVGLPVEPSAPGTYTAEGATIEINAQGGGATQIIRYDETTGQFVTHPVGTALQNFTLELGRGYFVRCTKESVWTVSR
jgi:hypothetical protein